MHVFSTYKTRIMTTSKTTQPAVRVQVQAGVVKKFASLFH